MEHRLDFLVIGAQKCATTWMHKCLREHPALYLPPKKREIEYIGGELYRRKGPDWYFSLFEAARPDQKIGDVSVEYIFDSRSAGLVRGYAPDVRIIVSLRNPVERAISAYTWNVRRGLLPNKPLKEGIASAIECFQLHAANDMSKVNMEIIDRGFYDVQLERYLKNFKPENLLILSYEDIKSDSMGVMKHIYKFLGVDDDFVPPSLQSRPKRNTHMKFLIYIEYLTRRSKIMGKAMDLLNQSLYGIGFAKKGLSLPAQLLSQLEEIYRPHNQKLSELLKAIPACNLSPGFLSGNSWLKV